MNKEKVKKRERGKESRGGKTVQRTKRLEGSTTCGKPIKEKKNVCPK